MVLCVTAMPHWTWTVHFWINLLNLETGFRALWALIRKRWNDGDTERGLKDVESTSFCSKFHRIFEFSIEEGGIIAAATKFFVTASCCLAFSVWLSMSFLSVVDRAAGETRTAPKIGIRLQPRYAISATPALNSQTITLLGCLGGLWQRSSWYLSTILFFPARKARKAHRLKLLS